MFFMMGITQGRKELPFTQTVICDRCGSYGRYMVFMTYTVLSLFFIPVFRWGKKYYVKMSCCGATYELDREVGREIERGVDVEIRPGDLDYLGGQNPYSYSNHWNDQDDDDQPKEISQKDSYITVIKRCPNCGFSTEEDYEYCPKCGSHLV